MNTILRNFLSVLRRYKLAMTLNIVGLSVAFAAFMVIMMQVDYDRSYNHNIKNADNIFRVEVEVNVDGVADGWMAIVNRPLAEAITASSPHIVAGAFAYSYTGNIVVSEVDGVKKDVQEGTYSVEPSFVDVFEFDMIEGSAKSIEVVGTVIIPQSMAQRLFGEGSITGKQFTAANENMPITVGGVYKDFPDNSSLSNNIYMRIGEKENAGSLSNWNYKMFIRVDNASNAADIITQFKANTDPQTVINSSISWDDVEMRLTPFTDLHFVTDVKYDMEKKASGQTLFILFCIAIAIVIIAGINYTNFSTALTPKRIRSINTQKVLGGDTGVIRRALVGEAAIICFASFLLACGIVHVASLSFLAPLVNADLSLVQHPVLLAITGGLAIITGIMAGLYPSYYVTSFPPALALKGNFGLSPTGRRLRNGLISLQFLAAFVLIIGAAFMYLQNYYLQHAPVGYDRDELIVATTSPKMRNSNEAVTNQLKNFSGIADVTYGQFLLSSSDMYMGWGREYNGKAVQFQCMPVEQNFLDVLGIKVGEGRGFREGDKQNKYGVYIFNETAKATYDMQLNSAIDSAEIIGFMPDVKFQTLRTAVEPMAFYVPGQQGWGYSQFVYIKVKAGADLRSAYEHVESTLKEFDSEYPFNVRFYDAILDAVYRQETNLGMLITIFSLIAVLISIVGVFGLVVFDSEYRRKEISLRKVFGSTSAEILMLFGKGYILILSICFVLASPIAWYAVSRWLENFAYRTPMYWWVYACAFIAVLMLTIATVTVQNWRAANANPIDSIKEN